MPTLAASVMAAMFDRSHINPPELFRHPAYTRVISVTAPGRMVFIAGQTPSDAKYNPVAVGNPRGQYLHVMEALSLQLEAAHATWADVVFRRIYVLDMDGFLEMQRDPTLPQPWPVGAPPPSTLIGVTRLSHPDFGLEIDLMAVTAS